MKSFSDQIAPAELIRQDFDRLRKNEKLRTSPRIQDLLFIQSIEGRSHNGAGIFSKRIYVNTSIGDIVNALGRDPARVKADRQALIDEIFDLIRAVVHGQKKDRLMNERGEPLLGVPWFSERRVNGRDILRGFYLGGLRDNPDIRKETEARYQYRIGCGKCYLVNTRVMDEMGLDGEKLAHGSHEKDLPRYFERGLLAEPGEMPPGPDEWRYYYVRHRAGPGQSDDGAIVASGLLYNPDVALGVFLADAVDTLEKYVPVYKDQDQEMAFYIGRSFKDLQFSLTDAYELAYIAAIPETKEEFVPDSSLRYLLSVDHRTSLSALECHLGFIERKPVPVQTLSFRKVLNAQFYEYLKKRLMNVRRLDALAMPEFKTHELDRPLRDIVRKNYLIVREEEGLPEAVRKFRASKKTEVIVVVDKSGAVIGTLSVTDLIEMAGGSGASA